MEDEQLLFEISDDSDQDDKNKEVQQTPFLEKQGCNRADTLDTPFLTKNMTDTESEHTTMRGTFKEQKRYIDKAKGSQSYSHDIEKGKIKIKLNL